MPTLSANTLFHFTDKMDNLVGILRNEFFPNYSLENWEPIQGKDFEFAIPMVCFCDIPLSQIREHTKKYGPYALGLNKEWGKGKGINPVLYTYNGAKSASLIRSTLTQSQSSDIECTPQFDLLFYMKLYEGKLWRKDGIKLGIKFYDEREWRYVPSINDGDGIKKYLNRTEFLDEEFRELQTKRLENKKLSFEPKDIKYIIVKSEDEIYDMVGKVRNIKDKFPDKDVDILITRIISMKHIREDF